MRITAKRRAAASWLAAAVWVAAAAALLSGCGAAPDPGGATGEVRQESGARHSGAGAPAGPEVSAPAAAPVPPRVPSQLLVPAGTLVPVRFNQTLTSHASQPGQAFTATVQQDVVVDARVAIPAGSTVMGTVAEASPAWKIGGRARLALDFHTLVLPAGERLPLAASFASAGRSQAGKDAAIIAGSTVGGALLGEAVDKGQGGVVGAIVGGVAGAVAAKKTKGKPVGVTAGSSMSLALDAPLTVTVIGEGR